MRVREPQRWRTGQDAGRAVVKTFQRAMIVESPAGFDYLGAGGGTGGAPGRVLARSALSAAASSITEAA